MIIHIITKTASLDITDSPAAATTRPVSTAESTNSQNNYLVDDAWDNLKLRGLTDIVRECIEVRA